MSYESDLLVIGAGPAGLCAAINASSEGLLTTVVDNGAFLGGQAKESSAIENYPGFPSAITGNELMGRFVEQAIKFDTRFVSPVTISKLARVDGVLTAYSDDYQTFTAKAVLISIGLSYRRLAADGISKLVGRGIYYGAPSAKIPMNEECEVAIIGGANSAGQAAVKLSENTGAQINIFVRRKITDGMSAYLIDRIRNRPNIKVFEGCEIVSVSGEHELEGVTYSCNGDLNQMGMDYMFVFIGATPKTFWLDGQVQLDSNKYILTGRDVAVTGAEIAPLPYETSMPGVFAAGDVRSGSTKRVASAGGEGATALQNIHAYLASLKS